MNVYQQEPATPTPQAPRSDRGRSLTLRGRVSPDAWAMIAVAAAVVLANLPYLLGLFDANPLGPTSGLGYAVTPGVLRGQPTLDASNGLISQAFGHRAVLDWLHFQLPWWNPYGGTGTPFAGDTDSAALFPPTVMTGFANGLLYERMLLELIAGLSTYLLLRRLRVNRWASTAAAIAFALNGTFAWFAHTPINPVPFLPMLLLGIELAYNATVAGRRGGWWLIAVAGAFSVYAGFPEVAYLDTLLGIFWFAWRCTCLDRERVRSFAGKGVAGAIAGTLLAAPALIALIDVVNHGEIPLHGTAVPGSIHLPAEALPQLTLPYVFGPIFGFGSPSWGSVGGYLTMSVLLFGMLGLISPGRRGLRLTLALWLVLALSRTYDTPHELGALLGVLPGMSRTIFPRYGLASIELSVIILAALGLDYLARAPAARRRLAWSALASFVIVALAAVGARHLTHQLGAAFGRSSYYADSIVWGVATVVAGLAAGLVRNARVRRLAVTLVVAADAIVLFAVPELSAPRSVRTDLAPVRFLQRNLGQSRFMTLGPLAANYGAYFGIRSLNLTDVIYPSAFARYARSRLNPAVAPNLFIFQGKTILLLAAATSPQDVLRNVSGYRAASVTFVLTSPGKALPESPTTFSLVLRTPTTWIYRLAGSSRYFTTTNPGCTVRPEGFESVKLTCPGPTVLTRRETYFPGWSAEVDGHPSPVHSTENLFQAVDVGPGSHRVSFSYQPPNMGWGFAAFAGACAWLVFSEARRRRLPRALSAARTRSRARS